MNASHSPLGANLGQVDAVLGARLDGAVAGELGEQCRLLAWCDGPGICAEYRDFDGSVTVTHTWTGQGDADALAVVSLWVVEDAGIGPVELAVVPSDDERLSADQARVLARELNRAADVYERAHAAISCVFPTATFRRLQSEG